MKQHDRFIEIIDHLNEEGLQGTSHYFQTPEGLIEIWWGSGKWEHKWFEIKTWPPTPYNLFEDFDRDVKERFGEPLEESEKEEDEKCPTCDGSGKVPYPWSFRDWDHEMPCPDCYPGTWQTAEEPEDEVD